MLDALCDSRLDLSLVRALGNGVGNIGAVFALKLFSRFGQTPLGAAGNKQACTLFGERARNAETDSLAAAGDNGEDPWGTPFDCFSWNATAQVSIWCGEGVKGG